MRVGVRGFLGVFAIVPSYFSRPVFLALGVLGVGTMGLATASTGDDGAPLALTATPEAAAPLIVYSVPNNTTVYDPNLQVIISICPEGTALSSHNVTSSRGDVQPDAQADCPSGGGTAYFVSWHGDFDNELLLGANDVSISACNVQSQCTYPIAYYHYALPIDNNITLTLLDPATELVPGQTDTIRVGVANYDTYAKTMSFSNGVKCVSGLGNCLVLDVSVSLPAKVGKTPGRDTVRVRVRGDSLGMGVANVHGCRSVGPPPTQICARITQEIPILPPKPVAAAVTVTPSIASTNKGQGASFSLSYTVENVGSQSTTFSIAAACSPSIIASGCTPSTGTVTLGPSASTAVTLSNLVATSPGSLTTGVATLTATAGVASATGQTAVTVGPNGGAGGSPVIQVDIDGLNPNASVSRDQCLMVAAGDAAGVECGDLRLAHALPAMQTMGQSRAPTLIYSSRQAWPAQLINANVTVLRATPSSIATTLTVSGEEIERSYTWPTSCRNVTCRIVVPFDAGTSSMPGWGSFPTGLYHFTLEVEMVEGGTPYAHSDTGSFVVVNRASSPFGAGWWLEGLEEVVHASETEKLWVGGDGSTRLYRRTPTDSNVYVVATADRVSRPDTLRRHGSNDWRRRLPNGAYVKFDNSGRHTYTVSALGDQTRLKYDSGRLDSLVLPVPSGSGALPHYKFFYGGAGKIDSVWSRRNTLTPRTTRIARVSTTNIDSIVDPGDAKGVKFGVDLTYGAITSRRNRLGDSVYFAYDSLWAVNETRISLRTTNDTAIVTKFCHAQTVGLVTCPAFGVTAVGGMPLHSVVTKVNGPRGGDIDVMTFHLSRFGGPDTLQDPMGGRTRLERSATFPALVTKVTDPSGQVQRAWYNARGLVDSLRVENPLGTGVHATTRIEWNDMWALPDVVKPPIGASTRFDYNGSVAKLDWQQVGPYDSTRVRFYYNAAHQLDSVVQPGLRERFQYDAMLGNVKRVKAADQVTFITRDSVGYEVVVADTLGLLTETIFRNLMGRVDSTLAVSRDTIRPIQQTPVGMDSVMIERWNNVPSRTRRIKNTFDAEGNLLSVDRRAMEVEHQSSHGTTSWTYDAARRVRSRSETFGTDSFWYDPAGLQTKRRSARGHVITQRYDVGGRLVARVIPGTRSAATFCVCAPWDTLLAYPYVSSTLLGGGATPDFVSPGDVETFTYDVAGRLRTANNRDARVSRTYLPGGTIATDTLRIRSWDPADTLSGQYDDHVYWLSFQNDLLGRRLRRDDSFGRRQAYVYHDSLGVLTRTSERPIAGGDSLVFTFTWDSAGRMSKRQVWNAPIEINESQTFDANGRLATRVEAGRISGTAQAVFSDAYTYDFRGKQRRRTTDSPDVALQDSSEMLYDGFGAVVAVTRHRPYGTMNYFTDEYDVDALGNVWGSHFNRYTNAGRSELNQRFAGERMSHQDPSPLPTVRGDNTYFPAVLTLDSASFTYDASGNQVTAWRPRREFHSSSGGLDTYVFASLGSEFTFHFYDAAERLRFTQRSVETTGAKHTMLDYRYDALGRRVLVRTRTDSVSCSSVGSGNTPPCLSTMDRYVWDGDQLLVELRGPGHWTLTTDQLDAGAGSGAYFGQVRYLHALGIDAPLAVRKGSATPFVPHASGRGGYEHGTYVNGDEMDDYHWPQRTSGVYMGADARIEPTEPVGWFGSLLEGKADASGLQYMRNRYYDPASGRFTQRDPIGLKGGLNQYSFAASDPVNGSDPFGLKVCFDGNPVQRQQLADSTMKATGTKFDLRWDNTEKMWCAANVRANGAWTWIARAFKYMVENSLLTLPIQQGATSANAGGRVWIDFSKIGDAYYDNSVFCTLSTTGRYTGPSIIAHELGHAYVQFLVTAPPPFTGEISWYPATDGSALAWENHVNVTMNGLAARVRGCDHP